MTGKQIFKVVARIDEIVGECPVYKGGEKIVIEGNRINMGETDAICLPLLCSLADGVGWRQHLGMKGSGEGWDYSAERQKCPRSDGRHGKGFAIVAWEVLPIDK